MKAKEFKKYQNYALSIRINDLDHDYELNGPDQKWVDLGRGCKRSEALSDEDREKIWDKEVISFYYEPSNVLLGNGYAPQILVLNISNLTAEEREARDRAREIQTKIEELERITGKKVTLGE